MKVLKIKDNNLNKKDDFAEIRTITGKIADKTLEQLEREGVFVFPEIVKDAELQVIRKQEQQKVEEPVILIRIHIQVNDIWMK